MALKRLVNEYKDIVKDSNYLFSINMCDEDIFTWEFIIIGPQDTLYENGIFKGKIEFPKEYPHKPPKIYFNCNMYHPNIYNNGTVCISILHEGIDSTGYEQVSERWSPTQNVTTIMLSIISLLSAPNFESPANVDISILYKKNYEEYKKNIYKMVQDSQTL